MMKNSSSSSSSLEMKTECFPEDLLPQPKAMCARCQVKKRMSTTSCTYRRVLSRRVRLTITSSSSLITIYTQRKRVTLQESLSHLKHIVCSTHYRITSSSSLITITPNESFTCYTPRIEHSKNLSLSLSSQNTKQDE